MVIKICDICGSQFEGPKFAKRCSDQCRQIYQKQYLKKYRKNIPPVIRICAQCGKEFHTRKYSKTRYCSQQCWGLSQQNRVERTCLECGKKFYLPPKRGKGKYCSHKCSDKARFGQKHLEETKKKISKGNKGKKLSTHTRQTLSELKKGKWAGEKNPKWKGGVSFAPYCPKFNNEFKERVRNFWNRECGICGEKENGRKLAVHHVNYEKMVCCDNTPPLFIPLCPSCHSKTNHKREGWEHNLTEYIMTYFNGESYLPK